MNPFVLALITLNIGAGLWELIRNHYPLGLVYWLLAAGLNFVVNRMYLK